MDHKDISQAVIGRLPRYFRYLGELKDNGVERISSSDLSKLMKVTASQIRQDLNNFGGFGQQGYGYNVNHLYTEISKILGLDKEHRIIVIGAGNLGRALSNYGNFKRRGFLFTGIFDENPDLIGQDIGDLKVLPMDSLSTFIKEHKVEVAVLAIPKKAAKNVSEVLIDSGISAIWNFAHLDIDAPDHVVVENVHLSDSLMKLSYQVNDLNN